MFPDHNVLARSEGEAVVLQGTGWEGGTTLKCAVNGAEMFC